jgi:hypothetical protein
MMSKNDILTSISTFFCQKFCCGATLPTFPLPTGFTVITRATENSRRAMVRSAVRRQSTFLSISHPGLRTVECGGRQVPGRASFLLFLSKVILLHCSGRIPKATPLYYTSARYCGGEFTPRESEVKTEWTPVVNRLPGPRLT